jgi:hypothetical protein
VSGFGFKLRYRDSSFEKKVHHIISHHIVAIMGGGSGLLKSLRLRSSSKKNAKSAANKDGEVSDAAASSSSPPSSSSLPETPRGFPGGGVAITCGSGGRSFFRNNHHHHNFQYDDNDSMINLSRSTAVETVTSSSATSTTSSAQPDPQQQASTSASPSKGLLPLPSTPPKDPNGSPPAASVSSSSATFGTPKIRGKEVASKAAIFESKSFQGSNSNSPGPFSDASSVNTSYSSLSPPPSNSRRSATLKHRDFWQTVLKPTSSEDEEPDLVSASSGSHTADVRKKSQWLQSAFSPKGGGNMPGLDHDEEDESTTQDLTETVGGDDGSVSVLSESVHTNTTTPVPSSPSYHNYWTASNTPPRRRSPEAAPALTVHDQAWTDAYQIWYQHGLLPWKPDVDECFPLQVPAATEGSSSNVKSPSLAIASPRGLVQERDDHDADQFHDSLMDDDDNDNENSAGRGAWMGGGGDTAPASPRTVQASRTLHKTLTQSCPLLTVFGGNGNGNAAPAPTAAAKAVDLAPATPEAPTTPKTMLAPEAAPATSPSTKSSSSSSSSTSPIKLLPSLTPSPSQVYSNYVMAYTAYVQDRHNPAKASAHNEARKLLEKSRTRQPL